MKFTVREGSRMAAIAQLLVVGNTTYAKEICEKMDGKAREICDAMLASKSVIPFKEFSEDTAKAAKHLLEWAEVKCSRSRITPNQPNMRRR